MDKNKLVDQIIRERVHESRYWKEECFGLNEMTIVDKMVELDHVGGIYAGNIKVTKFLCLLLKMLQLSPDILIVAEYLNNTEFKYMRALAAVYVRLVCDSVTVYTHLEPLYSDYRRLRAMDKEGKYYLLHMDELVDSLLRESAVLSLELPLLQERDVLEETEQLGPKTSLLDVEFYSLMDQAQAQEQDLEEN